MDFWFGLFCIFLIVYISLLNTFHSSFNFLAIWNTIIITNLISLLILIFVLVLVCFWLVDFSPNLRLYFPGLSMSVLLSQTFNKKRCWTFLLWHKYDWALFWDAIKLFENCFYFWDLLGSDRAVFSLGLIIAKPSWLPWILSSIISNHSPRVFLRFPSLSHCLENSRQ